MSEQNGQEQVLEKPESQLKEIWYSLCRNKGALIALGIIVFLIFVAVFRDFLMPYDPNYSDMGKAFQRPNSEHWFGTDQLGRDIFSRIIYGTRISLSVGLIAVTFALTVGTVLGSIAGYFGGKVDTVIMRCMDMMLAVPSILLAITFMAALGKGIDKAIIAIGLVSILPNVLSSLIVRATLGISTAVLDTAALGFLGLGVQPPIAEWGDMLGRARGFIFSAPYTLIFPGMAISLTVLAFNMLGDGLRDALDPKSRNK